MRRESHIAYAMLLMGFAAMAIMLFGLSARAADQMDRAIGPAMESEKELPAQDASMQRIDPKAGELTKEMEKPMRVPDTAHESQALGYQPLCGPSKNAIHHYACGEGYDAFAF